MGTDIFTETIYSERTRGIEAKKTDVQIATTLAEKLEGQTGAPNRRQIISRMCAAVGRGTLTINPNNRWHNPRDNEKTRLYADYIETIKRRLPELMEQGLCRIECARALHAEEVGKELGKSVKNIDLAIRNLASKGRVNKNLNLSRKEREAAERHLRILEEAEKLERHGFRDWRIADMLCRRNEFKSYKTNSILMVLREKRGRPNKNEQEHNKQATKADIRRRKAWYGELSRQDLTEAKIAEEIVKRESEKRGIEVSKVTICAWISKQVKLGRIGKATKRGRADYDDTWIKKRRDELMGEEFPDVLIARTIAEEKKSCRWKEAAVRRRIDDGIERKGWVRNRFDSQNGVVSAEMRTRYAEYLEHLPRRVLAPNGGVIVVRPGNGIRRHL